MLGVVDVVVIVGEEGKEKRRRRRDRPTEDLSPTNHHLIYPRISILEKALCRPQVHGNAYFIENEILAPLFFRHVPRTRGNFHKGWTNTFDGAIVENASQDSPTNT